MKELIVMPIIAITILGFVPHLVEIAEASQEKAVNFADDMNNAIDCAALALPLEQCSPGLFKHNFTQEIDETLYINEKILESLEKNPDK